MHELPPHEKYDASKKRLISLQTLLEQIHQPGSFYEDPVTKELLPKSGKGEGVTVQMNETMQDAKIIDLASRRKLL